MFPKTYLFCIGTRPEIIKMAPVYRRLKAHGQNVQVLHTGQHGAVADALYAFFGMPPDTCIDLQRQSSSLAHLSVALMNGIEQAMHALRPDVLLVQGDTSSALVGALVGYYNDVPVAHIEAGLRTGERDPFPEEKNRQLIAQLAHWHFTPTPQCTQNLRAEGVAADRIVEVGNTVIDAAQWTSGRISRADFDLVTAYPADLRDFMREHLTQRLVLVTAHRRENWGAPIRHMAQALAHTLAQHPDVVAVWPVHPNPAVRADVEAVLVDLPPSVRERICLTEPLGYPVLIALLLRCHFALTDSGGIQEEASAFGKPVLIARQSTERQELVQAGGAVLVGTDVDGILRHATTLLTRADAYRAMQLTHSPFGDGHSAQRIAATLVGVPVAQVHAPTMGWAPPVRASARPVSLMTTATA
jgi:UDP-N-acetylglucosamine 2-epimerase